jgi:hypothetical protein
MSGLQSGQLPRRSGSSAPSFPRSIIPFPLYLFRSPRRPVGSSRRCVARWRAHVRFVEFVNLVVGALNVLFSSFAADVNSCRYRLSFSDFVSRSPQSVSVSVSNHSLFDLADGNGALRPFYCVVIERCRRVFHTDCGAAADANTSNCAGGRSRVAHALRVLGPILYRQTAGIRPEPSPSRRLDSSHFYATRRALSGTALPIVASRVSLPTAAAVVNLSSVLGDAEFRLFAQPQLLLRSDPPHRRRRRMPRVAGSAVEYARLVERMVACGMVSLASDRPLVTNGVFCVAKPDSTDLRLIIDCRPVNDRLCAPAKVELPNPELFARLLAPSDFWVAKCDLSDFYHRIALPPAWYQWFGLPPIEVGGKRMFPTLRSLPMGWSFSVLVAQRVHECIVDAALARARFGWRLTRSSIESSPVLSDDPAVAVYIDDLSVKGTDRGKVQAVQDAYIETAAKFGLPVKASKTVAATRRLKVLGVVLDGEERSVAPPPESVVDLLDDTATLCESVACTYTDCAAAVGRANWLLLMSRPLLSVFNNVYAWLARAADTDRPRPVWPCLRRELACAALLAVVAGADLSLPLSRTVVASDASLDGVAVVAADCDDCVDELFGCPMQPPGTGTGAELPLGTLKQLRARDWSVVHAGAVSGAHHINVYECDAMLHAANAVRCGVRQLVLVDSSVVFGAMSKGRSSCQPLLRRCRRWAAMSVVLNSQIIMKWLPSGWNPADGPSRGVLC